MTWFKEVIGKGVKVEPRLLALLPGQKAELQCDGAFLEQATWIHLELKIQILASWNNRFYSSANDSTGVCAGHEGGNVPWKLMVHVNTCFFNLCSSWNPLAWLLRGGLWLRFLLQVGTLQCLCRLWQIRAQQVSVALWLEQDHKKSWFSPLSILYQEKAESLRVHHMRCQCEGLDALTVGIYVGRSLWGPVMFSFLNLCSYWDYV